MKKTIITDSVRNILKNFASYISIILITFLGVASFLSMDYTATALRHIGSDEYNRMAYRDLEITSPLLLNEEDFDLILNTEGIKDAEKVYFSMGRAVSEKARQNISIISLTERINLTDVTEGRLPVKDNECAIEKRLADEMGWNIGDKVKLYSQNGEENEDLKENEFEITGYIIHPDHTNPKTVENPYVTVLPSAFCFDGSEACISAVEVRVNIDKDDYRFGKDYLKNVENAADRIKKLGEVRYPIRYKDMRLKMTDITMEYIDLLVENKIIEKEISEDEFVKDLKLALMDDIPEIQDYKDEAVNYLNEREKLESLEDEGWLVADVRGSSNFVNLMVDCESISKLESTFSLMFLFIGILVVYVTIGKIINEQREQVGTMKAFGFRRSEVFAKYLFFSFSATFFGVVIGILSSRFLFEVFVLSNYNVYYTFDIMKPTVTLLPTVFVAVLAFITATASCFFACRRLLDLPAVNLLQPRIPQINKKNKEKKHIFSLYIRLIIRNTLSDAKRVAVTVVSVAGCCALVVTGFTLRFGSDKSPLRQFSKINAYDEKITSTGDPGQVKEIAKILRDNGADHVLMYETNVSIRMGKNDVGTLISGDIDSFAKFYHLYDIKTGLPLKLTDEGIYIPRRTAELYSLKEGDEITITTFDFQTVKVKIVGIFETYIGTQLIMSDVCYDNLFAGRRVPNTFYVKTENANRDKLDKELWDNPGYNDTIKADEAKSLFDSATAVINAVIVLFIFLSVLMAGVVLVNLTNMYLLQKKKELTVMRINGFMVGETIGYMMREAVLTTACGIILGCATGYYMGYRMLKALEQPYVFLVKEPSFWAWIIGFFITVFFTSVVYFAILRKIKKLSLSDI
ncbi:MAG: ABC transporter permease [Lachnospiraceae bacterium]|nr:ABC transporter permease [Lachnospiraceae bacterium]